jgi:hypothetical protein
LEREVHALQSELALRPTSELDAAVLRHARKLGTNRLCPTCLVLWSPVLTNRRVRFHREVDANGKLRWVPACPHVRCPDCLP